MYLFILFIEVKRSYLDEALVKHETKEFLEGKAGGLFTRGRFSP